MHKKIQILSSLFLNILALFDACASTDLEELSNKLAAPMFKAERAEQRVLLFGTMHELPLKVLTNHAQIKEEITQCEALFVENNHILPITEADECIPTQVSQEGQRRINTVFQHYGFTKGVEAYDLFSQALALSFYDSIQGMDCELINAFKNHGQKPIVSLDQSETREDHENVILEQLESKNLKTQYDRETFLNKVYRQALKDDPKCFLQEGFAIYEDTCAKLMQGTPFEYEKPDPDHTRERTREWIQNSLEPYLAAHQHTKIAIVVGALHLEDLIDWFFKKGFNGTIIRSDL